MTDRDYDDNYGNGGYYDSGPPTKIYKQIAEDENARRYTRAPYGCCTTCNMTGPVYWKGTFTKLCSACIEKEFVEKFKSLHEEFLKYKSKKI